MGQGRSLCCCNEKNKKNYEEDDTSQPMLYRPPQPASIVPIERNGISSIEISHPSKIKLLPSPPSFFKRLDDYIHKNKLRALDVFNAMDQNNNKKISCDDLLDGFYHIQFDITNIEKYDLMEWMNETIDKNGLNFKEFTLALKLRRSHSP